MSSFLFFFSYCKNFIFGSYIFIKKEFFVFRKGFDFGVEDIELVQIMFKRRKFIIKFELEIYNLKVIVESFYCRRFVCVFVVLFDFGKV